MQRFTSHYPGLVVHVYPDGGDVPTVIRFEGGAVEVDDAKVARALAAMDLADIDGRPFVVAGERRSGRKRGTSKKTEEPKGGNGAEGSGDDGDDGGGGTPPDGGADDDAGDGDPDGSTLGD